MAPLVPRAGRRRNLRACEGVSERGQLQIRQLWILGCLPDLRLHRFDNGRREIDSGQYLGAPQTARAEYVELEDLVVYDIGTHEEHPVFNEFGAKDLGDLHELIA